VAIDVATLVAGLLLPFAFSPFDLFPLAVLSPALLFVCWRHADPGRAAFRGFLFGLGMFGLGVSWIYVSLHLYGNMPAPLAAFATLLFVATVSLYPALLGWLQARFFPVQGAWKTIVALPSLWMLVEWLRGWLFTGFPWLNLGYSQASSPLAGYASWVGVYGTGFFCALSAGLLAWGAQHPKKFLRAGLPWLAAVWIGGWFAGKAEWVEPAGEPIRVALIQGNVPLDDKWRPGNRDAIMQRYASMSVAAPRSDLIVWPESALPVYLDTIDPAYLDGLHQWGQANGADFLFGVVERDKDRRRYYNSVMSISPQPGLYRKQHLVPFGEYPPLEPVFSWLMQHLQIPMSDFTAGLPGQPLLFAAGQKLGVSVCYEDAFGEEVIRALPAATLLVNVSEDAWFGDSLAPHQRIQMARLRAIETGRPLLRVANTGPSVAIDHRGHVLAHSRQFQATTVSASVQPMQGATPYVRFGNFPVVALASLLLVTGLMRQNVRLPKKR
jgi:apolipoprotein N-acyltransferase